MVQDDAVWLLQIRCQLGDVLSCQAVGAEDGFVFPVCPKYFLLIKTDVLDFNGSVTQTDS